MLTDGHVDIVLPHALPEVHASPRLRHSHDTLDVSDGDRHPARSRALPTQVRIQPGHLEEALHGSKQHKKYRDTLRIVPNTEKHQRAVQDQNINQRHHLKCRGCRHQNREADFAYTPAST